VAAESTKFRDCKGNKADVGATPHPHYPNIRTRKSKVRPVPYFKTLTKTG
jgi:hypothetical protein